MSEHNSSETETEEPRLIETQEVTVQYNSTTESYRTVHNWNQHNSLSTTVLLAIGAVTGDQPSNLPPLSNDVDPDALDSIFEQTQNSQRTTGRMTFPYAGFLVTIHADGEISFHRLPNN